MARRYLRSRRLWWGAVPLGVLVTTLAASYVVVNALTLTSAQTVARDLGRFDFSVQPGLLTALRGDPTVLAGSVAAVRASGATETVVVVESRDVTPDVPNPPLVKYVETDWSVSPFPDRYVLLSGDWPDGPGEVAITQPLAGYASGQRWVTLAGAASWTVTGQIQDRYATRTNQIFAAPGTWSALPWASLEQRFPNLVGSVSIFAVGGNADEANQAIADLPRAVELGITLEQLTSGTNRREVGLDLERAAGVARQPLAYLTTSAVVVPLGVLLAFALGWRRSTRQVGVLRAVGLRTSEAVGALVLATAVTIILGAALGLLSGWLVGLAARSFVVSAAGQPLSPIASPQPLVTRMGVLVLLPLVVFAFAMLAAHRRSTVRVLGAALPRPAVLRHARHTLAAAVGVVLVWQSVSISGTVLTQWLIPTTTALTLLLGPSFVMAVLNRLPDRGPRGRLILRGLQLDRARTVVAIALIAATTGPTIAILVGNASNKATLLDQNISLIPTGQAQLASVDGSLPLPPGIADIVAEALVPTRAPVIKRTFADRTTGSGPVVAVRSVADIERLNKAPLPGEARRTLEAGGVLYTSPAAPARRPLYVRGPDSGALTPTASVPSIGVTFERSWAFTTGAFVLLPTVEKVGGSLFPASLVYTDLPDPYRAEQALIDAGYDPAYVETYRVTTNYRLGTSEKTATVALTALLVLVLLVFGRAQHVALREYSRMLLAVGLGRRWVGHVLMMRLAIVVGAGLLLGLPIAAYPIAVMDARIAEQVLAVPWTLVGGFLLVALLAAMAVAAVGARQLRVAGTADRAFS